VFDTLREWVGDTAEDDDTLERADNPKEPYGDVEYADPGYQADGKKRYPLDSEEHCRAAWSYINQEDNAAKYSSEELAHIKGRIRAALKRYGVQTADRSEQPQASQEILRYDRAWALDDIIIRSGGDGRTVEAYAAVFDTPSEIKDQHGHYMEVISRAAFNRAISHGINRINVFYNHGLTVHGTSDSLGSVPIGSPVDIQPDGRGLRTVTRFNRSQLADSVLEAIRAGDIRGYSFRGRIFQSNPARVPRPRPGSALPTITRTELGLAEYGPTPTPAYADAGIVAVRSLETLASTLVALEPDDRAELVRMLTVSTPHDPETGTATPDVGPGTEDSPDGRSGRFQQFQAELRKRGVLK
jgi:HK97 family phage prohead protease